MKRCSVLALLLTQLSHIILASGLALGQSTPQKNTQELQHRIERLMKLVSDRNVVGALAEGESVVAFAKEKFGENSEAHGLALAHFALALYADYMGNLQDASRHQRMADMAERASSLLERLNAPADKVAFLWVLLWVDRLASGRYEELVKLTERLLPYSSKQDQVAYLTGSVVALVTLGRIAEAEAAGKRAVDLAEQLGDSQQLALAEAIDKLAWVYQAQAVW